MKVGDEIIWCCDYQKGHVHKGTVTKVSGTDVVYVDGFHKAEDYICQYYCWPAEAEEELKAIIAQRAVLKKAFDDSMVLVYQLRNKYSKAKL